MPALALMRDASASMTGVLRLAQAGVFGRPDPQEDACLDRMAMSRPATWRDRLYATLLRGAIRQTSII